MEGTRAPGFTAPSRIARRSCSSTCAPSVPLAVPRHREQQLERLTGLVQGHETGSSICTSETYHRRMSSLASAPGARRLLVISIVARLPLAMLSIGLLVHTEHLTGSFAAAGAVTRRLRGRARRRRAAARPARRPPRPAPRAARERRRGGRAAGGRRGAAGRRPARRPARARGRHRARHPARRRLPAHAAAGAPARRRRGPRRLRARRLRERADLDRRPAARARPRRAVVDRRRAGARRARAARRDRRVRLRSPPRARWRPAGDDARGRAAARSARPRCGRSCSC